MGIRSVLFIALVASSTAAFGQIYKTVDADGNVVFTDIAPVDRSTGKPVPQAVTVPPTNTYDPPVQPATQTPDNTPALTPATAYAQLNVISPTPEETIRDNAGNVQVEAAINPPLRGADQMLLLLDGSPVDVQGVNGVFELSNVNRGAHTVAVRVVDSQGNVVIDSDPTTFYLMRISINSPQRAKPQPH